MKSGMSIVAIIHVSEGFSISNSINMRMCEEIGLVFKDDLVSPQNFFVVKNVTVIIEINASNHVYFDTLRQGPLLHTFSRLRCLKRRILLR